MEISLENWCLDIKHITFRSKTRSSEPRPGIYHGQHDLISLEDSGYRSGVDPFPQPSDLSWSYAAVAVSSRNALFQVSWEGGQYKKSCDGDLRFLPF